jgi:hypothetical protein
VKLRLWDVATGKPAGQIDKWQGRPDTLLFLRDGKITTFADIAGTVS